MTVTFHVLWMLCALGATTFAAAAALRRRWLVALRWPPDPELPVFGLLLAWRWSRSHRG